MKQMCTTEYKKGDLETVVGVGVMGWGGVYAGIGQGTDAARVKVYAADDAGVVWAVLVHGQRVRPPALRWQPQT
jgi:hypothetical protein